MLKFKIQHSLFVAYDQHSPCQVLHSIAESCSSERNVSNTNPTRVLFLYFPKEHLSQQKDTGRQQRPQHSTWKLYDWAHVLDGVHIRWKWQCWKREFLSKSQSEMFNFFLRNSWSIVAPILWMHTKFHPKTQYRLRDTWICYFCISQMPYTWICVFYPSNGVEFWDEISCASIILMQLWMVNFFKKIKHF
jgi:hypothetical protein